MVSDGSIVGIIHFENFAKIALGMTVVKDSMSRKRLMDMVIPVKSMNVKKSNIWNGKKYFFTY